ncbi:hypothetical protein [Sediminicola luteus]|uniref:Uncharacterized protein n=1 Tax=Sediminicola luteus TaxID=319238 RepID=A0A2A4GEL7_9FLAO|nr:hypothetical protein [Sediminicola luteus]PCE66448.1 hypothetical protein B7P33_03905 [Sediminicola luteus]
MRILLLLLLLNFPGERLEPEELIGRQVSELYEWGWTSTHEEVGYYKFKPAEMRFCDRWIRELEVRTNDQGTITEVSFQLREVVQHNLYRRIGEKYGEATHMSVADGATVTGQVEVLNDSTQNIFAKPDFSAKDVAIEEKPLFLSWRKEGYSLEVLNQYVVGTSLFQFKKR